MSADEEGMLMLADEGGEGVIGFLNTYSFRIMTQRGVAKFDFFEIFYTQGPFGWKGWGTIFLLP